MTTPIAVRRYGTSGPLVAVLHGGPGAPGSVASLARELADGLRVLEPLQRRHGDGPLTVARHVDDLIEVLDEPTHLVGWSWGAMLALSTAARRPRSVRSLTLVGCGTYDLESRAAYRAEMARRRETRSGSRGVDEARFSAGAMTADERRRFVDEVERAQAYDPVPDVDDGEEIDAIGHRETWDDVLRLQAEGVEPAAFARIAVPVTMLHGDDDPHPGRMIRDALRRHVPHLEYVGFPRCGHTPWRERHAREPFLAALRQRLRA